MIKALSDLSDIGFLVLFPTIRRGTGVIQSCIRLAYLKPASCVMHTAPSDEDFHLSGFSSGFKSVATRHSVPDMTRLNAIPHGS